MSANLTAVVKTAEGTVKGTADVVPMSAINLKEKEFSTGSIGYTVTVKMMIGGVMCQVTGNAVIIGSNPNKSK